MLRCYHRGLTVWALGALLATTGCSTSQPPVAEGQQTENAAPTPSQPKDPPTARQEDEKRVEAHAHYAQAMIYDLDDEQELALKEFSEAAADDPSNEELALELTRRYLAAKQPEQALEVLKNATAVPGASGELFARMAMVYSRLGKQEEAMDAAQTAIKRSPRSLTGYENLVVIHLQSGRPEEALKTLDRAAKVPDASAEYLANLGELYANFERQAPSLKQAANSNGLAVLDRASKLNPANPLVKLKLADDYNVMEDTTNAARIYADLIDHQDNIPAVREDVRSRLAEIYLRNHDTNKAEEQLEALIQDDPANSQAYYLLGSLAYDQKKLPEAVDYFQKTLLLSDDFEQAYYDLAGAQINMDKPKDALNTLDKARAKFPAGFMLEFLSGLAYGKQKDYTNELSHFTVAETIARTSDPERLNRYFYFEAGAAYERSGNYEEAQKYFEKCLQMSPDFAEALNYLGYMWADRGVKLDKAREMIEKAVKLDPKNPAYLDSLGWILYRLNKPDEALAQVQKAVELSEEPDPTLYDHLGDIYAALKQTDKAREAWKKSLSLEPNEQIQKKLDHGGDKTDE